MNCNGNKYVKESKKIVIDLKNTMGDNTKINFENEGDEDVDAGQGHLVIIIKIDTHDSFKRNNNDLILEKDILLSEALSGTHVVIRHMDGRNLIVKTNKIIKPFSKYKIKGEGMNKQGDLIVVFNVIFPDKLDEKRKLYLSKLLPEPTPLTFRVCARIW